MSTFTSDLTFSKITLIRTVIAVVVLMVFSFIENKMIPWGVGYNVIFPLTVVYVTLGLSIGSFRSTKWEHSASYGILLGLVVFGILHSWLLAVGYYNKGPALGFAKFLLNILALVVAAIAAKELPTLLKLDKPKDK